MFFLYSDLLLINSSLNKNCKSSGYQNSWFYLYTNINQSGPFFDNLDNLDHFESLLSLIDTIPVKLQTLEFDIIEKKQALIFYMFQPQLSSLLIIFNFDSSCLLFEVNGDNLRSTFCGSPCILKTRDSGQDININCGVLVTKRHQKSLKRHRNSNLLIIHAIVNWELEFWS